jgi:hypothetical protein
VTAELRTALASCRTAAQHLTAALEIVLEAYDKTLPGAVTFTEKDLQWIDEVLPGAHGGPAVLLGETFSHAADVGTPPANSTSTVPLGPPVLPVMPVRIGANVPHDPAAKFILDNAVTAKGKVFNPVLFAELWAGYPRKVGKKKAEAAFTKLCPTRAEVARMLAAIEDQRGSRDWIEGFIPHLATWLNGERWADEPEAAPPPSSSAAKRIAIMSRAVGPRAEAESWRNRCTHDPPCDTPTLCELKRIREGIA